MKMFGVARHSKADHYASHVEYRDANDRGRSMVVFAQPHEATKDYPYESLNQESTLWYTSSLNDAEQLASILAKKFPFYEYIAFKSEFLFKAPPSDVTKSQFTTKGLLPA